MAEHNQLLSDEEIAKLQAKHTEHVCSMDQPPMSVLHIKSFVADVIAAHTAKLLEGVALPEPDFALDGGERPCYYADTVAASLAAARAEVERLNARIDALYEAVEQIMDDDSKSLNLTRLHDYLFGEEISADCVVCDDAEPDARDAEIAKLKTVMIAAAEEIQAHWEAHCDQEGYGPSNLMRRLEEGIPSEYSYTAGRFAELQADLADLKAKHQALSYERDGMLEELVAARAKVEELRKIAAHVPSGVYIKAKEAAGLGTKITLLGKAAMSRQVG